MNRRKRTAVLFFLCLFIIFASCTETKAAGMIDTTKNTELTISFKHADKAVGGVYFEVYMVAYADAYAQMHLTAAFEPYKSKVYGLSDFSDLDQEKWAVMASTLKGYVQRDKLSTTTTGKTDTNGILKLNLKPGLYLVFGKSAVDGDYTYIVNPFMLFLPGIDNTNNEWNYYVTASPKSKRIYNHAGGGNSSSEKGITRKVLKVWDDNGYEDVRPEKITVRLLKDGDLYDTVTLSADNNWQYSWNGLGYGYEWTAVEDEASDYEASMVQNGITYTATNVYNGPVGGGEDGGDELPVPFMAMLPQTGVLWWPVPVLLLEGFILLALGIIKRRSHR